MTKSPEAKYEETRENELSLRSRGRAEKKKEESLKNNSKILIMANNDEEEEDGDLSSSLFSQSEEAYNMTLTNTSQEEKKFFTDRTNMHIASGEKLKALNNKFQKKPVAPRMRTPEVKSSIMDNSLNDRSFDRSLYKTPEPLFSSSSGFDFKNSFNEFGLKCLGIQTEPYDEDIFPPFDHRVCLRCKKNDMLSPNYCRFNNIQSIKDISSFSLNTKTSFKVYNKHRYGVNIGFKTNERVSSVKRNSSEKGKKLVKEPLKSTGINTIICNKDFL